MGTIHLLSRADRTCIVTAFMVPITQTSVVGTEHISVSSAQDAMIVTFLGFQVTPQNLDALITSSVMDNNIPSTITGKLSDKQRSFDQDSLSITSVDANITNSSSFNGNENGCYAKALVTNQIFRCFLPGATIYLLPLYSI